MAENSMRRVHGFDDPTDVRSRIEGLAEKVASRLGGTWRWQGDYFCREMTFGDKPVEADCQVVAREGDRLRFIAERGQGQQANLTLR